MARIGPRHSRRTGVKTRRRVRPSPQQISTRLSSQHIVALVGGARNRRSCRCGSIVAVPPRPNHIQSGMRAAKVIGGAHISSGARPASSLGRSEAAPIRRECSDQRSVAYCYFFFFAARFLAGFFFPLIFVPFFVPILRVPPVQIRNRAPPQRGPPLCGLNHSPVYRLGDSHCQEEKAKRRRTVRNLKCSYREEIGAVAFNRTFFNLDSTCRW